MYVYVYHNMFSQKIEEENIKKMEVRVNCKIVFSRVITLIMLCYFAMAYNSSNTKRVAQEQVPCFFVFGDSLVDHGNNNDIITLVKSNFWPYGIDFPLGATGRFTNGRTFIDLLTNLLGFTDFIPAFSRAKNADFIKGVNFASGAAGIKDVTGNYLGANIPMNNQISNFERVIERIREHFKGDEKAVQNHLSKCIIYSGIGNNDYLNNFFMPWLYPTDLTPEDFAKDLIHDYTHQLKALYDLGVRKVVVTSVAPIGCIPLKRSVIVKNGTQQSVCNEDENHSIQHFNSALRHLVDTFNHNGQFPGAKFVLLDYFSASMVLVSNRKSYGIEVLDKGCCGVGKGRNGGEVTCLPLQTPCEDRSKYFFWDVFHPSEVVHAILAKWAFTSNSSTYAHPINIKQLALL